MKVLCIILLPLAVFLDFVLLMMSIFMLPRVLFMPTTKSEFIGFKFVCIRFCCRQIGWLAPAMPEEKPEGK